MDSAPFPEQNTERSVIIVGSELVENYTVYVIEVKVGEHRWRIKHRYSDFHDLHEKLTSENKIDKHLLPPKKIIGKNSKSLVEKRQKELEVYLQTLLRRFPVAVPKVFSTFLHFSLYEINGITATLAEDLFHRGEQLLAAGEVFLLRPLQLFAVTQQLRLAKPTCANGDAKADLGHILDFACRLKYLEISGTDGAVGSSNIEEQSLQFDLSVFKSLLQIKINDCTSVQVKGLPSLKSTLVTLGVHRSAASMKEILVPEAAEFAQWEPEGIDIDCTVTAVIPTWKVLTTLDMSENQICGIDESVKLIPAVEFLDLSHNHLSTVDNLQYLYNLVHLDLSHNKLTVLEGAHTKLGNIKTLNLAGNQLETLSGLSKLYSLVNLDLSQNRLVQMEEIKHIGTLPCLEKLSLSKNPLCINPDYRTKVLAQFWDRASEVCLDGTVTTEKERDTVEVLKAIQKAKEAKDRMASGEKKISDVPRPTDGGSNAPPCSVTTTLSSSCPPPHSASSSSQELTCRDKVFCTKEILTHVDSTLTQRCDNQTVSKVVPQDEARCAACCSSENLRETEHENSSCCYCSEHPDPQSGEHPAPRPLSCSMPVVSSSLTSYTASHSDFMTQLCDLIARCRGTSGEHRGSLGQLTEGGSPDSGSHYFEMGPDHSEEITGRTPLTLQDKTPESAERPEVQIAVLAWSLCVSVDPAGRLDQGLCHLAATGDALLVLQLRSEEAPRDLPELMDRLQPVATIPYSDIKAFGFCVPESCVSLRSKSSDSLWCFFSDGPNLTALYSHLDRALDRTASEPSDLALFMQQFLRDPWDVEENEDGGCRGLPAHVLTPPSSSSFEENVLSDFVSSLQPSRTSVPVVLFLTTQHLCVLKVDFVGLASKDIRTCARLTRIPLQATLLHPTHSHHSSGHGFCGSHVVKLVAGPQHLDVIFVLPDDKSAFLRRFAQLRTNIRDIKTIALLRNQKCQRNPSCTNQSGRIQTQSDLSDTQKPRLMLSLLYPGESLIQQLSEDNQCPPHLSLSPSLLHVTSLRGPQILNFFHDNISEVKSEELKHILWTSVLFYQFPDVELTACILLSTKALYFILHDVASTLRDQAAMWNRHPSDPPVLDFLVSFCLVMKLEDLRSVNVGLFDQYFRLMGNSPEQIVSCLTRDSYSTHHFLQQLMSVLSLLEKVPSPEPSDQDFYTQFGKKSTGRMENYELVHSSRVKFLYPSEEEIGDLTFIAAESKGPQASTHSFNVLFYALAFQVHVDTDGTPQLHPKSLVLSGTHVFLLDEDYISYPLPQFAKEPPQRDKYRLTDARRIRDLDRVLMGYQPYPQALTLVYDDVPGPDLLCHLTMDHFSDEQPRTQGGDGTGSEVQWCIFVPGADSRERLISLLARQWEALCSRELPLELTG